MSKVHILIAGGGIGGHSTALALADQGFEVTVLERASHYQEIGAGIQLGPNAFHAFDRLKVCDARGGPRELSRRSSARAGYHPSWQGMEGLGYVRS
jgi:2-polyprenyl-6-methoxyphenol hydroxylase-like FAD-dependent oxidoreductase